MGNRSSAVRLTSYSKFRYLPPGSKDLCVIGRRRIGANISSRGRKGFFGLEGTGAACGIMSSAWRSPARGPPPQTTLGKRRLSLRDNLTPAPPFPHGHSAQHPSVRRGGPTIVPKSGDRDRDFSAG